MPGLDLGLTPKNVPPPPRYTHLPHTHWLWWGEKPTKPGKMFLLPGCVCVRPRVLFLHAPHPTPPPNPCTPSLLLLRLRRRQPSTSRAGGSGVGRGKRLNPSPWRLLPAAVGHSNEKGLLRGVGRETVPPVGGRTRLQKASQRRSCSLKFKTLALFSTNQPWLPTGRPCAGRSLKPGSCLQGA